LSFLKNIWNKWYTFSQKAGNFQTRVIISFFYFLIVAPFGLLVRVSADPLKTRRVSASSFWMPKESSDSDLESVRRQF
jgi:hypothetical protein